MLPDETSGADARMRMFNSDGSEGSMCGNALRCFAMWLFQTRRVGQNCRIAMRDRIVAATILESDEDRRTAVVSVNMGAPVRLTLPTGSVDTRMVELPDIRIMDAPVRLTCVSMGNPHAVVFVPDLEQIQFETNGPAIERHREFPDRTNVEFVQPIDGSHARVRVWERGSGETMACGSGACAVAVAGISAGVFRRDLPVVVEMQGGPLEVTWSVDGNVLLRGPAVESFRGELLL